MNVSMVLFFNRLKCFGHLIGFATLVFVTTQSMSQTGPWNKVLNPHLDCVTAISTNYKANFTAIGNINGLVDVWSTSNHKYKATVANCRGSVVGLIWTDNPRSLIALGDNDQNMHIWRQNNGSVQNVNLHSKSICAAKSPNDHQIAVGHRGCLEIIDIQPNITHAVIPVKTKGLMCICWLSNRRILAGTFEGPIIEIDLVSKQVVRSLKLAYRPTNMQICRKGKCFVVAGLTKSPQVLQVSDGKVLFTLKGGTMESPICCILDNGNCVTGSWDGSVRFWSLEDGRMTSPPFLAKQWIAAISNAKNEHDLIVGDIKGNLYFHR